MPRTMVLRIQSKCGRFAVSTLYPESTLHEFQKALKEKTKLLPNVQKILLGYPPREIGSYNPNSTLLSLKIRSGETIILEELSSDQARKTGRVVDLSATGTDTKRDHTPTPTPPPSSSSRPYRSGDSEEIPPGMGEILSSCLCPIERQREQGRLVKRVVPADNSCVFRSISILLCNGKETSSELRELAAGIILSNPEKYSSVFLGQNNLEYVQWLQKKESWGGAIELTVFSEHYQVELDVVDIQTQRIDRFGEDKGHPTRAFLLYDGIHYDPIVMDFGGVAPQRGVFPVKDDVLMVEALQIAKEAHKARQFTDVSKFSLRCLVCSKALTGQTDAMTHAKQTGHSNFGEV